MYQVFYFAARRTDNAVLDFPMKKFGTNSETSLHKSPTLNLHFYRDLGVPQDQEFYFIPRTTTWLNQILYMCRSVLEQKP
jgi:hypothetical protein